MWDYENFLADLQKIYLSEDAPPTESNYLLGLSLRERRHVLCELLDEALPDTELERLADMLRSYGFSTLGLDSYPNYPLGFGERELIIYKKGDEIEEHDEETILDTITEWGEDTSEEAKDINDSIKSLDDMIAEHTYQLQKQTVLLRTSKMPKTWHYSRLELEDGTYLGTVCVKEGVFVLADTPQEDTVTFAALNRYVLPQRAYPLYIPNGSRFHIKEKEQEYLLKQIDLFHFILNNHFIMVENVQDLREKLAQNRVVHLEDEWKFTNS